MITYRAQTFIDSDFKDIKGGHSETFESEYQIQVGDRFRFEKLSGGFLVIDVTVIIPAGTIQLLCSPRVK